MSQKPDRANIYKDKQYARYVHSGEALAIAVIKGSDKCPWSRDVWLDVIDNQNYDRRVPVVCQPRIYDDWEGRICFNWVVVETFPRVTAVEYVDNDDMNRYLTWKAATDDIQRARNNGYHGKRYLVLISLRDENKDAKRTVRYLKPHRSERDGRWVDAYGYLKSPLDGPRPKPIKVIVGPEPKWVYSVNDQTRITAGQLAAIKNIRFEIVDKIRDNRGASLSLFPLDVPKTTGGRKQPKTTGRRPKKQASASRNGKELR